MLKVFEAFAGIGAQRKSLQRLGIPHEIVGISETDKYAYKSYEAIHGSTKNYGDITKISTEELPYFDLFTYSFPCTDISIAGKQQGLIDTDGNLTRSGLLYEALRIIKDKMPKYLLAENVKNLVSKKFELDFKRLLNTLEQLGYRNYWKILNAKDYGVPQNRERVFVVSIRKDVQHGFEWPETFDNGIRLKHLLETEVDEKYYINDKRLNIIYENLGDVFKENFLIGSSQKNAYKGDDSICPSLTSAMGQGGGQTPMIKMVGMLEMPGNEQIRRVYSTDGISPTLNTMQGGNRQPKIIEELPFYRIRKLTPLECIRLMNFDDEDYYKIKAANMSDTQIYKQCGNSIVVACLEGIFKNLLIPTIKQRSDNGIEFEQIKLTV
jgi:DNA (cytosine-5)-methyltransferase 1